MLDLLEYKNKLEINKVMSLAFLSKQLNASYLQTP
jgi:hypothetical protein